MSLRATFILKYGLVNGIVCITIFLIAYLINVLDSSFYRWLSLFLNAILVVFMILLFKKDRDGKISFKDSISVGLGTGVLASLTFCLFFFFFTTYINPSYFNDQVEALKNDLIQKGMSINVVYNAMESAKKFMNNSVFISIAIATSVLVSFILSLLTGAIVRTDGDHNEYL